MQVSSIVCLPVRGTLKFEILLLRILFRANAEALYIACISVIANFSKQSAREQAAAEIFEQLKGDAAHLR